MILTAKELALQDECIQLIKNALTLAKRNGLTRSDIVRISSVSNVTILAWLNRQHFPNTLLLGRVINACGKQFKVSII